MRAEDILPDGVDHGEFKGVTIRKGTVAAFLANARAWSDPASGADVREAARHEIVAAIPALNALGLFEVMDVRDASLRTLIASH